MNESTVVLSKRRNVATSSNNGIQTSSNGQASSMDIEFRQRRARGTHSSRHKRKNRIRCFGCKVDVKSELIPLMVILVSVTGILYILYASMSNISDVSTSKNQADLERRIDLQIPFPEMANRKHDSKNFIKTQRPDPWKNKPDVEGPDATLLKAHAALEKKQHKPALPYQHVDWTPLVGDATENYSKFRHFYEQYVLPPNDTHRTQQRVKQIIDELPVEYQVIPNSDYDVFNCPEKPHKNYPMAWKAKEVLDHWPTDTVDPPPDHMLYQGLCVFDYQNPNQYHIAQTYQSAELPFVIRNDPAVLRTVERWNHPRYLSQLLGKVPHRCEHSKNNHFMYFNNFTRKRKSNTNNRRNQVPEGWTPPTELLHIPFDDFMTKANSEHNWSTQSQHWYYRLIGCGQDGQCDANSSEYLFDELPFFQPNRDKPNLYLVEPQRQKGIHCRFGMKGVIAENHYDGSRNMIVVLGGQRRYLLGHPDQCLNMALYPMGHPSARHSAVDWSDPTTWKDYPQFVDLAEINEVVLQPGDVLYLPTHWFHYIVSLTTNYQCNTRSGIGTEYASIMHDCGFR